MEPSTPWWANEEAYNASEKSKGEQACKDWRRTIQAFSSILK
jgi:hypothetical protein